MELYIAGNFPWLRNPELEKAGKEIVESLGLEYKRLVSYYFPEDVDTIISIKKGDNNGEH